MTRPPHRRRFTRNAALVLALAIVAAVGTAGAIYGSDLPGALISTTPRTTPAPGERVARVLDQTVEGQQWSLAAFTNAAGEFCAGETVPSDAGDGGQGLSCRKPETLFKDSPLVYFVGARQRPSDLSSWANVWVWGFAAPDIHRLELRLTNCARLHLPITEERLFFKVFGRTDRSTIAPQDLVAYDQYGGVVAEEPTPLSPPSSPAARAAGAAVPERSNCDD